MKNVLRKSLLVVLAILMTACAAATPAPTPTGVPTEPPTATATPEPTATSTPVPPTATPVPPTATATPAPTATPLPTNTPKPAPTKVVTPKPTSTKAPAVSPGGGVSSQPTSLENSMRQALAATSDMINLLDQMKQNNDASLCQPLLANYRSLHSAPVYEANGENYEWGRAYDAYRQAVGLADSRADIFEGCGQNGGVLGSNNYGAARTSLVKAQLVLEQGIEWAKRATSLPANASLVEAVTRVRLSTASLLKTLEDLMHDNQMCEPIITEYNILLQAPTYDVRAQTTNVQGAYSLYRRSIEMTLDKTKFVVEVCSSGGGKLYNLNYQLAIATSREAIGYLDQALAALQQ